MLYSVYVSNVVDDFGLDLHKSVYVNSSRIEFAWKDLVFLPQNQVVYYTKNDAAYVALRLNKLSRENKAFIVFGVKERNEVLDSLYKEYGIIREVKPFVLSFYKTFK